MPFLHLKTGTYFCASPEDSLQSAKLRHWISTYHLLLFFCFVKGILFVIILPPWQGPDEPSHLEYIAVLSKQPGMALTAKLDSQIHQDIISSLDTYESWEHIGRGLDNVKNFPSIFHRPPLYYFFNAQAAKFFDVHSLIGQLYLARTISSFFSLCVVVLMYKAALLFFLPSPHRNLLSLFSTSMMAFLPQFSFLSGCVNSDSLAILCVSATIYLLFRMASTPTLSSRKNIAQFSLLTFLVVGGLITKKTTFITLVIILVTIPIIFYRSGDAKGKVLGGAVNQAFFFVVFITAVFLCTRAASLDMFGKVFGSVGHELGQTIKNIGHYGHMTFSFTLRYLAVFFMSFWFSYGWMVYKMGLGWYMFFFGLTCWSAFGLLLFLWQMGRGKNLLKVQGTSLGIAVLTLSFYLLAAVIGRPPSQGHEHYVQARHIFPALIPLFLLFTIGIWSLCPKKYATSTLKMVVLFFLLLNATSLIKYMIPTFYLL